MVFGLAGLVWSGDQAKCMMEQDKSVNSWSFLGLRMPILGLKTCFKRRVRRCQRRTGITYNIKTKGRRVTTQNSSYELREPAASYRGVFEVKNDLLRLEKAYFCDEKQ